MSEFTIRGWMGVMLALWLTSGSLLADQPSRSELEFFETKIRPVLADKCYRCHSTGAKKLKAGLMLDHRSRLLKGGDSGASIEPGKPEESLLYETIVYENPDLQMPPKSKLDNSVIADFKKWIEMGAPWPEEEAPGPSGDSAVIAVEGFDISKRRAAHWSWQPIVNPDLPELKEKTWPSQSLDHFILAGLEEKSILPAREAEPATWLRRVYFDLIGLPPTPEEISVFLEEKKRHPESTEAEQAAVDQLLNSPHFGERWARHWMDLVRYAETAGHEFDYPIPHAWRYRDYLIHAFNQDVPYDQFLTEHLAGDLLVNPRRNSDTGLNESIVATGYWFLHEAVHAPTDIQLDESERVDNQIDVFGKTFLGQALGCARCHDHKFDAISTADYYAMSAFLQSSRRQEAFLNDVEISKAAEAAGKNWNSAKGHTAEAFGPENPDAAKTFARYLLTAGRVNEENASIPANTKEIIFEDFENGYGDWKIEGKAFGKRPASGKFGGQKLGGYAGKGLVNTYLKTDKLTGRAISPEFTIKNNFIHFLIAGGKHERKTCVNLLLDGKVVLSATGQNHDQLKPHSWDVRKFRAKKARIEIVDEVKGGWGHIDLDHIVFSDDAEFSLGAGSRPLNRQLVERLAREARLSPDHLARWAEVLQSDEVELREHPLHAFTKHIDASLLEGERERLETALNDMRLLANFENGDHQGWTSTGKAFRKKPVSSPVLSSVPGALISTKGVMHSGLVSPKLQGVLRSPTFELSHDRVHLRMKAKNVQVRLVIDSHYMNHFHTLLLKGTILKNVDTKGQFTWQTMAGDLNKYLGHRAWIEIKDMGDGYAVIDEVRLSNGTNPPLDPRDQIVSPGTGKTPEERAANYGKLWAESLSSLAKGNPDPENIALVNFVWDKDLMPTRSRELLAANESRLAISIPGPQLATAMLDGTPENARIHIRGSHKRLGEEVPRRNLTALGGQLAPENESGRLALARQLIAEDNPLVRRVLVNRVWHHLFGRGIVASVDDFGKMGIPPSHPELLDHLAFRFSTEQKWSLKQLLRSIVLSSTYRMSSIPNASNDPARLAEIDPENILLHRAPIRRLQGEAIRDAMLFVSGSLDPKIGGSSVPVHLTDFMEGRGRPGKNGPLDGANRRSLYGEIRRNFLPPFMMTFDMPAPFNAMGRRSVSNVPAQALALLNDPFVIEEARRWAGKLQKENSISQENKIEMMFLYAFGRKPNAQELSQALAFLQKESDDPAQAWADLCHVLFNKKEFVYIH